jgi:hypothetical protein
MQSFWSPSSVELMIKFYCLKFERLSQSGGPGSSIFIPQEQGSPVNPPGIGLASTWRIFIWTMLYTVIFLRNKQIYDYSKLNRGGRLVWSECYLW